MSDFWKNNAIVQIDVALFLIVVLLLYIAFRLSENRKRSSKLSKTNKS